jgi:hypothetical protein
MILGSSIGSQRILVKLTQSLVLSHSTPEKEVVVAALQAEFDMDVLTS